MRENSYLGGIRLSAKLIVLFCMTAFSTSSLAEISSPIDSIELIYKKIENSRRALNDREKREILSSSLQNLIVQERALAKKTGQVGVDWDVLVNGQNLDRFRFIGAKELSINDGRRLIYVEFLNGQINRGKFSMIVESNRWKIDNIIYEGQDGYDIRRLLTANIKRFRHSR